MQVLMMQAADGLACVRLESSLCTGVVVAVTIGMKNVLSMFVSRWNAK